MNRTLKLSVILGLIACFFTLAWMNRSFEEASIVEIEDSEVKTLKFVFEVINESNQAIKNSVFQTYFPIDSETQSVVDFKVSREYSIISGDNGNRVLESNIDFIAPYGTKKITISTEIKNSKNLESSRLSQRENYLVAEKFIEVDDEKIFLLAKQLSGATKRQTAENIYNWVTKNIRDSGYVSQDKGARFALETRKGDCTEFMYLTIALARAAGIHSRGIGGYVYKQSTVAKSADYHNWAELFFDGKWQIVDGQKKRFLDATGDYVSIRYLADKKTSLLGSSHRFSAVNDNLKVKML